MHTISMKTIKNYNIYIFISTLARNIIDLYSVIFLYNQNISIKNIIFIYAMTYFLGFFISNVSLSLGSKVGYKYILILSTIITSVTFYIIHNTSNIYLISIFLSLSTFTYHPIRHLYGVKLLKYKKEIGNTLIYIYLAQLLSTYLTIKNISITYLIILLIISIIPALFIKKEKEQVSEKVKIPKQKIKFFFFDQFKIIFLLLEPLYLYLIENNLSFVGIFNIILTISSIICIYFLSNKINISKKYPYINIIFTIILILKLNIYSKTLLLIVAFLEGIGIKANELVSTLNLYDTHILNKEYIIISEQIFCMTRSLILSVIYFLPLSLKTTLYILLIGIFILSFQYKKNTLT